MDVGVELGLIQKSGAFYRYNDKMIGQGKAASMDYLKTNPEIAKEIVAGIMNKNKTSVMPVAVGVEEESEEE